MTRSRSSSRRARSSTSTTPATRRTRTLLADALYDVTGRRLELVFELGEAREAEATEDEPAGEEEFVARFQQEFDTRERES